MNALDRIQYFVNSLEEKTFYMYLAATLGVILALCALITYHYYSSMSSLQERIEAVNEQRTQIQRILATHERVKKHRAEVDALLSADETFKIGGYYKDLLTRLGLASKQVLQTPSHTDHEKYRESILKAQLTDMNMKQLCELLNAIDQYKRVFIKELEINKAKGRRSLDVTLTIATLEPRSATA